tara:strand:+ start:748 stop:1290 length:543 start_codon:yes stop_codon:yes gene_type:complete
MSLKRDLLGMIHKSAYRKGKFKLSSGIESEHYVNCKPVTLNGGGLSLTCMLLLDLVPAGTRAVGGLTLGADPLVAGMALMGNYNGLIVRKKPKGHGTGAWIEGPTLEKGSKVVVLEDVITTGGSAILAVEKIRDAGYDVDTILTIVDRQQNGEADKLMDENNIKLRSLLTLNEIATFKPG